MTMKRLLQDPRFAQEDGSVTDYAHAAHEATNAAHNEGIIPDPELETTDAINPDPHPLWLRELR